MLPSIASTPTLTRQTQLIRRVPHQAYITVASPSNRLQPTRLKKKHSTARWKGGAEAVKTVRTAPSHRTAQHSPDWRGRKIRGTGASKLCESRIVKSGGDWQSSTGAITREFCRLAQQGWSATISLRWEEKNVAAERDWWWWCLAKARTLQSTAKRRASMMAVLRSRVLSKASTKLRSFLGRQNIACEAASPPPLTPHNCNEKQQQKAFRGRENLLTCQLGLKAFVTTLDR